MDRAGEAEAVLVLRFTLPFLAEPGRSRADCGLEEDDDVLWERARQETA